MKEEILKTHDKPPKSKEGPLAAQARTGDMAAYESLVDMYSGRIFRMIFFRTRSRMDAEDLTQEVFLRALKNLPGLRDESKFGSWLFSIAINTVRDFHRKRKLLSLFQPLLSGDREWDDRADDSPLPLDAVLKKEFWNQVESFSNKLSRWEREVFYLRFFDDLGIDEIAQTTAKSPSTVKTHLYRAIAKYKQESSTFTRFLGETP